MFLLFLLLFTFALNATTYDVGGGAAHYATIQACATAMGNGDICKVYAGTYNEHVSVPASGAGTYKTLQVNGTDLVYVYDFTLASRTKIIGFHVRNPSSPASANCVEIASNATDIYITGNDFYACGSNAMIREPSTGSTTSYVRIQNNTFSYSCSTSASPNTCTLMHINGNYHLIENNDISHVSDGMYLSGSYNVVRNNTFHDNDVADCGSNSGNCHIDFMQADATYPAGLPAKFLLIEGNIIKDQIGGDTHGMGLYQAQSCSGNCNNAINRFNIMAHVGAGAFIIDNSGSAPPAWDDVKAYNNHYIDVNNIVNGNGEGTNSCDHGSQRCAVKNELFYYPRSLTDFNAYMCQAGTSPSSCDSISHGYNLAWCTSATCNIRSVNYGSGAFTDNTGNIKADPLLVNYASGNYNLSVGSPAIDAGTHLTTVAVADTSTGTSLVVTDAGYFQDGYTQTADGVQADWIRIGTTTTVQISSINYSTNTITLASSVSRSDGDPVYLYRDSSGRQVLYGSLPDIGALESGATPLLSIKVSGSVKTTGRIK